MGVPGAFFEVTGKMSELDRIFTGIEANEGRLTSNDSMSLDLWLEMKEEWFRLHDAQVHNVTDVQINRLAQYLYEEIDSSKEISLVMAMTGKPELVAALTAALKQADVTIVETLGEEQG